MGISELDEAVFSLTASGLSQATSRSYKSGVYHYSSFCTSQGLIGFPCIDRTGPVSVCPFFWSLKACHTVQSSKTCVPSIMTNSWRVVWTHSLPRSISFITSSCVAIILYPQTCMAGDFHSRLSYYDWSINIGLFVKMTTTLLACGLPAAQSLLASCTWRSSLAIPRLPTIRPCCH